MPAKKKQSIATSCSSGSALVSAMCNEDFRNACRSIQLSAKDMETLKSTGFLSIRVADLLPNNRHAGQITDVITFIYRSPGRNPLRAKK